MPNERFWRFVIVAILALAGLTACFNAVEIHFMVARTNCHAHGQGWQFLSSAGLNNDADYDTYKCVHVDSTVVVADTLAGFAHVR